MISSSEIPSYGPFLQAPLPPRVPFARFSPQIYPQSQQQPRPPLQPNPVSYSHALATRLKPQQQQQQT